jgi:hypothetical protein
MALRFAHRTGVRGICKNNSKKNCRGILRGVITVIWLLEDLKRPVGYEDYQEKKGQCPRIECKIR